MSRKGIGKAYIEEAVDFRSKAGAESLEKISQAIRHTKTAFRASAAANWETPFYQYANRLAHLHFLRTLNGLDAYLLFIYFADAPDVPRPSSEQQWEGAVRLTEKCLGLTHNRDTRALQLKLDELIRSTAGTRPQLMHLEELDDEQLDALKLEFERLRVRRSRGTG